MQTPISARDGSRAMPVNSRNKWAQRLHVGNLRNSSKKPSSHAWKYRETMAAHRTAPCQDIHALDWYQGTWIHSLMHHEPTIVFYQHGFRSHRNDQDLNRQLFALSGLLSRILRQHNVLPCYLWFRWPSGMLNTPERISCVLFTRLLRLYLKQQIVPASSHHTARLL